MKKGLLVILALCLFVGSAQAQSPPAVTKWKIVNNALLNKGTPDSLALIIGTDTLWFPGYWADSTLISALASDSANYADTAGYADTSAWADSSLFADSTYWADSALFADSTIYADTAGYVVGVDSAAGADSAAVADSALVAATAYQWLGMSLQDTLGNIADNYIYKWNAAASRWDLEADVGAGSAGEDIKVDTSGTIVDVGTPFTMRAGAAMDFDLDNDTLDAHVDTTVAATKGFVRDSTLEPGVDIDFGDVELTNIASANVDTVIGSYMREIDSISFNNVGEQLKIQRGSGTDIAYFKYDAAFRRLEMATNGAIISDSAIIGSQTIAGDADIASEAEVSLILDGDSLSADLDTLWTDSIMLADGSDTTVLRADGSIGYPSSLTVLYHEDVQHYFNLLGVGDALAKEYAFHQDGPPYDSSMQMWNSSGTASWIDVKDWPGGGGSSSGGLFVFQDDSLTAVLPMDTTSDTGLVITNDAAGNLTLRAGADDTLNIGATPGTVTLDSQVVVTGTIYHSDESVADSQYATRAWVNANDAGESVAGSFTDETSADSSIVWVKNDTAIRFTVDDSITIIEPGQNTHLQIGEAGDTLLIDPGLIIGDGSVGDSIAFNIALAVNDASIGTDILYADSIYGNETYDGSGGATVVFSTLYSDAAVADSEFVTLGYVDKTFTDSVMVRLNLDSLDGNNADSIVILDKVNFNNQNLLNVNYGVMQGIKVGASNTVLNIEGDGLSVEAGGVLTVIDVDSANLLDGGVGWVDLDDGVADSIRVGYSPTGLDSANYANGGLNYDDIDETSWPQDTIAITHDMITWMSEYHNARHQFLTWNWQDTSGTYTIPDSLTARNYMFQMYDTLGGTEPDSIVWLVVEWMPERRCSLYTAEFALKTSGDGADTTALDSIVVWVNDTRNHGVSMAHHNNSLDTVVANLTDISVGGGDRVNFLLRYRIKSDATATIEQKWARFTRKVY